MLPIRSDGVVVTITMVATQTGRVTHLDRYVPRVFSVACALTMRASGSLHRPWTRPSAHCSLCLPDLSSFSIFHALVSGMLTILSYYRLYKFIVCISGPNRPNIPAIAIGFVPTLDRSCR
jgi:hypothetical protein